MLRALLGFVGLIALMGAVGAPSLQAWSGPPAGEAIYGALASVCHQYPSRSFWLWGRPMALCVRCVGGYVGILGGAIAWSRLRQRAKRRVFAAGILLAALGIGEASLQAVTAYESSTAVRFFTGASGGLGLLIVALVLGEEVRRVLNLVRAVSFGALVVLTTPPVLGAEGPTVVRLVNGTVVGVKTQEELTGEKLKAGQEILMMTSTAVVVDGVTVIRAGAPVVGFVQDSKEAQMAGVAGGLSIAFRNTTAVDGTVVPLSGQFLSKGEDQVGRNVAVGVILCPFVLLDKGGAAAIPAGAETRAMTIGDFKIRVPADSSLSSFNRAGTGLAVARVAKAHTLK